jgi:hypothetical protein
MYYADLERIRDLKQTAKWSTDSKEKEQAILQLRRRGSEALPAIREILAITAYDEIKQTCVEAIRLLGRAQDKNAHDNIKTKFSNSAKKSKRTKNRKKKGKQTKK